MRFEDSLKIQKQDYLSPWVYAFGLDGESIIIGMGSEFHKYWTFASENRQYQPHLMMSVYKDCIVAALEQISYGLGEGNYAWEQGFADKLEEKMIKVPEKASFSELNEIALKLIKDDGIKQILDSDGIKEISF